MKKIIITSLVFIGIFIIACSSIKDNKFIKTGCISGDCNNSKGTYLWEDGSKYTGEWTNGKRNGYGIFIYKNGSRYEGNWVNDKKNGTGKLYIYEKSKFIGRYEGTWENDEMHGEIKMYDENNKLIITNYFFHGKNMGSK